MSAHVANPTATAVASGSSRNWGMISLVVGLIFLALSAVGLFLGIGSEDPRPFLSWLIGAGFWLSILIGALILIMLSYLFSGGWMVILRRQLEHAVSAFKWMALIFLPLFLIAVFLPENDVLPWLWLDHGQVVVGGETVGHDPLYVAKSPFLNVTFFVIRAAFYFGIWIALAELFRRHSYAMDRTGDVKHYRIAYRLSALGVFLVAGALTFASIDWFKSIEYHWFSTMYGVWFFAASIRAATAALIIGAALLASRGYLRHIYGGRHSYLLGCLLLAFTVFWAYISFSQYFLQYNANIPEEVYWYNIREFKYVDGEAVKNSWWFVSMFLIFAHFLVPFLLLLWHKNKFGARIVFIAAWTLTFHLLDLYWNILPQKLFDAEAGYTVRQFGISIWDVTMLIGVGAICVWSFLSAAAKERPIPVRDPRIAESVGAHD